MVGEEPQGEGQTPATLSWWNQIDSSMASALLGEMATQMHQEIEKEKGEIRFRHSRNQNSLAAPSAILAMHLRRTDEWCHRLYEMYQDVWLRQGNSITPGILRAICQYGIGMAISARKNAVIYEFQMEADRTGEHKQWTKAATEEFARGMERLFGSWTKRVEVDAKTLEHQLQPVTSDNLAARSAEKELKQARERIRHFEAEIFATETKVKAFQQSLSTLIVQGGPALQIKGIEAGIRRFSQQKADLEFRRDDWRTAEKVALQRLETLKRNRATPSPTQSVTSVSTSEAVASPQIGPVRDYSSETKRAVHWELTRNPSATALEVCRGLDDREIDLPSSWSINGNRLFVDAYKNRAVRKKIEKLISKVRADLRRSRKQTF